MKGRSDNYLSRFSLQIFIGKVLKQNITPPPREISGKEERDGTVLYFYWHEHSGAFGGRSGSTEFDKVDACESSFFRSRVIYCGLDNKIQITRAAEGNIGEGGEK